MYPIFIIIYLYVRIYMQITVKTLKWNDKTNYIKNISICLYWNNKIYIQNCRENSFLRNLFFNGFQRKLSHERNFSVVRPEPIYNTRVPNVFYILRRQIPQIYDCVFVIKTTWSTLCRKWDVCFEYSLFKQIFQAPTIYQKGSSS